MVLRIYQAGVYTVANDATPLGDTVVTPENKLPVVDKAQLEHILGRQHYIRSIDPAVFDSDRVVPSPRMSLRTAAAAVAAAQAS